MKDMQFLPLFAIAIFVAQGSVGANAQSAGDGSSSRYSPPPDVTRRDNSVNLYKAAESERKDASSRDSASRSAKSKSGKRVREGSQIVDWVGHFQLTGDGATFYPHDNRIKLDVLENLNLERIVRSFEGVADVDKTRAIRWRVSGAVTEFRGSYYLLISRAIRLDESAVDTPQR